MSKIVKNDDFYKKDVKMASFFIWKSHILIRGILAFYFFSEKSSGDMSSMN